MLVPFMLVFFLLNFLNCSVDRVASVAQQQRGHQRAHPALGQGDWGMQGGQEARSGAVFS